MENDNIFINTFIDKLCRERYDAQGNDVAAAYLQELLEQRVLTAAQFSEVAQFDAKVRAFEHLAMEENVDLDDPKSVEAANQYEKFVEKSNIHPQNKAALYNTLLGFIDINGGGDKWYMRVLRKKADIMPHGVDAELNLAAKQAFFHRRGAGRSVYLGVMNQLYTKMNDKMRFTFLGELGLVADKSGKRLRAASGLTPQQRTERLSIIDAIVKEPLKVKERIALLEEGLGLASNNLYRRNVNFDTKSRFSMLLKKDYKAIKDTKKADKYEGDSFDWRECCYRAIDYGKEKARKEGRF
ncbi:MAG: hypothetical protein IJ824_01245 [Alphaproteobacteria bacterium]|nr:hypothetical protein [Alphaproteobacteria bacterium]